MLSRKATFEILYFAVDQESRSGEHSRKTEAWQKSHNLSKTQKSHLGSIVRIPEDITSGAALC